MKKFTSIMLVMTACLAVMAQSGGSEPIPVDPEYRIGRLNNGLTYYLRHNTEPAGRASFYIIQNVGAVIETDDQNGLAHFLEHLAFNGTVRFPGKEILNRLERHGVAFGANINAYTSWDETVYNLSDVPVNKPGLLDTCLMILADWSEYIALTEEEINKERGVLMEEWRTRRNADWRMTMKMLPVLFEGSQYAVRNIIGDTLVIRTVVPERIRQFYNDWYRTDLQAIVVIGEIDVNEVENKIKNIFSAIPAVENPLPRPVNLLVPKRGTRYLLITDPEASETSVMMITIDSVPDIRPRDTEYIRDDFVISLMNRMMSSRFSEIVQKGDPPFVSGSLSYGSFIPRNYNVLALTASVRDDDESKAFEAAFTEYERVRRYGFTNGELERAKATMLANFENRYRQKDKISNDAWADRARDHFLTGEPLPSMDVQYDYYRKILPLITVKEVSDRLKDLISDDNSYVIIQGPDDKNHLTEEEVFGLMRKVRGADIKPYEDVTVGPDLIGETLPGSAVIKTVALPRFGAAEWTLSNGAKVVYRHADYEKDNVTLFAYAFGGASVYADSLVPSLSLFPTIISMYGAGDYDNVALTKMLAGKKASLSLGMQETLQTISGSSTPKDFETMMQLLYLKFARPNFNREAFDAIMGRFTAVITSMQKNPDKIMSDSLSANLTGYHPRTFIMTPESMKKIRFEDVNYIYKTAFDDASSFTFFITGNIDEKTGRSMAEKYIGSLPSTYKPGKWKDHGIRQPDGTVRKEIQIPLTVPKARVIINYSTPQKFNPKNNLSMDVLSGILDLVYMDKVREEKGGTYSVSTNATSHKRPMEKAELLIAFECDPERASELKEIVYGELHSLATTGPKQTDLDKAVSNMLKTREEAAQHNNYWAGIIRSYYLYGIDNNDDRNFADILNKLQVKDMKKMVRKYLSKADLLEMVFIPEKK